MTSLAGPSRGCCRSPVRRWKRCLVLVCTAAFCGLALAWLVPFKSPRSHTAMMSGRDDALKSELPAGSAQARAGSTSRSVQPNATIQAPKCTPRHQLVFIKTHKTGSSTVTTLLQRYGVRRDLNFALPSRAHFFSPARFQTEAVFQGALKSRNGSLVWQALGGFNVLANHARYNRPLQEALVPAAVFFSIVRDPVAQLESAFGYFPDFVRQVQHGEAEDPLRVFLRGLPATFEAISAPQKEFLRNGQMYDLGFEPERLNDSRAVGEAVAALDRELDLVLINEHFDESLVLLRKLLCWDFDDIVYISKGVRKTAARRNVTDAMRASILEWNHADARLYRHFNRTFWDKVRDYGPDFGRDLATFRRLNAAVGGGCLQNATERFDSHRTSIFRFKGNASELCQDLVRYDISWVDLIRKRMRDKASDYLARVDGRKTQVVIQAAPQTEGNKSRNS